MPAPSVALATEAWIDLALTEAIAAWESSDTRPAQLDASRRVREATRMADTIARTRFLPGNTLGRYVLLDRVGEGGMGAVYAAFDSELNRRVALKLLRPAPDGSFGDESNSRLLREGQAMARLRHPNTVAVYDVSFDGGKPFVAMELIDGTTLRRWMQEQRRPWRAVLEAFSQAGRGLAAAHAAGVVHRDFKPENVIIGRDGRARVTDFGLARRVATEAEAMGIAPTLIAAATLLDHLTREGTVMGTLAYMSPEQLAGRADARSDQFSFCLALFEALHGRPAYPARDVGGRRAAMAAGQIAPTPIDSRVPERIDRAVRRGLRALPEERYPSMEALLADLGWDPGRVRRRAALAGGAALLAAGTATAFLVLGGNPARLCQTGGARLAGVWDSRVKEEVDRSLSTVPDAERTSVEQAIDGYARGWVRAYADGCESTWVRKEMSPQALSSRMLCLDERLAELRTVTGLFSSPGGIPGAIGALGQMSPALDCGDAAALARIPEVPFRDRKKATEIRLGLSAAKVQLEAGQYRAVLESAQRAAGSAGQPGLEPVEAEAMLLVGQAQKKLGDYPAAVATLEIAARVADESRHDVVKGRALVELAGSQRHLALFDRAAGNLGLAAATLERVGGDDELDLHLQHELARLEYELGHYRDAVLHEERAIELARGCYGPSSPRYADEMLQEGDILAVMGAMDDALEYYGMALQLYLDAHPGHPQVARIETNMGVAFFNMRRYGQALDSFEHGLADARRLYGDYHPDIGTGLMNIGDTLHKLGREGEALARLAEARKVLEKVLPPDHPLLAGTLGVMGETYSSLGNTSEAVRYLERAVDMLARQKGDPNDLAENRFSLARVLWARSPGSPRALDLARQALAAMSAADPVGDDHRAEVKRWLAARQRPAAPGG